MRLHYGCKNYLSSNQLAIVIAEKIPEDKETEVFAITEIPEVFAITEIPEEQAELENGYYRFA